MTNYEMEHYVMEIYYFCQQGPLQEKFQWI
jgi:hypothetical protein